MSDTDMTSSDAGRPIGFWGVWGLTVGTMIGSGIFLLPAVLAPFGLFALLGWVVTGVGAICLALILSRLAIRSPRSGGPAVFVKDAMGPLAGFIAGWSLWVSLVIAVPAIAMTFVGYAGSLFPVLSDNRPGQVLMASALIITLTLIVLRGDRNASAANIILSLLKLVPLIIVIGLAILIAEPTDFPPPAIPEQGLVQSVAAVALLTMWAFLGVEAGVVATDVVRSPHKTIPRGVMLGVLTVAAIYMMVTVATMGLVPQDVLAVSEAPLVEATKAFGAFSFVLVAVGAMVSTAGATLALLFVIGHLSIGMARDGLAPHMLTRTSASGSPKAALLTGVAIGIILLGFNLSEGLIGAFTFLLMMSTATALLPYFLCAVAEVKQCWTSSWGWAMLAIMGSLYSLFALYGSGFAVLAWGGVLVAAGLPIFWYTRQENMSDNEQA